MTSTSAVQTFIRCVSLRPTPEAVSAEATCGAIVSSEDILIGCVQTVLDGLKASHDGIIE
jgi:hypothetical protein